MFLFLLGVGIFQCDLKKILIDTVDINARERILSVAENTFRSAMYRFKDVTYEHFMNINSTVNMLLLYPGFDSNSILSQMQFEIK